MYWAAIPTPRRSASAFDGVSALLQFVDHFDDINVRCTHKAKTLLDESSKWAQPATVIDVPRSPGGFLATSIHHCDPKQRYELSLSISLWKGALSIWRV
jgi:hypothetical protein